MLLVVQTALELGFLYAPVALALFLSFRVLDIADLTTDGCFVLGAAVSVTLTAAGHPLLAVPAAMLAGACAGFITAFHSGGHRHQYGALHHQPHGHGLALQREPVGQRHRIYPAALHRVGR